MTRDIARRVVVTGKLFAVTPLHVGGVDSRPGSDLPVAVNGRGKFYIPGTSLAGALRAWCADALSEEEEKVEALWGSEDSDKGHASHVIVEDAVIVDSKATTELRDHVRIDRFSGSAKKGLKFDREILPAGTELSFRLIFEEKRGDTRGAEILASLLQALTGDEAEFWLGAARSRGLGRIKLTDVEVLSQEIGSRDGILNLLRGQSEPSRSLEALCPRWREHRRIRPLIKIRIGWSPDGPMMVKAGADGRVVDSLPLLSKKQGHLHFALPGSSAKGALRSQAERIVATLYDGEGVESARRGETLIAALFGAPNSPASEKAGEADWLPGLSALTVQDCFSNEVINGGTFQHMLAGGESGKDLPKWTEELREYKKSGGKPYLDPATHVAIDRWTGGASDKALFTVLEPWAFTWEELVLTLDPTRLPADAGKGESETALAVIALLLLTLTDFVRGEIPLGFGTNRGFGSVKTKSVSIDLPDVSSAPDAFPKKFVTALAGLKAKADGAALALEGAAAIAALSEAWTAYLQPRETGATEGAS